MDVEIRSRIRENLQEILASRISLASSMADDETVKRMIAEVVHQTTDNLEGITTRQADELVVELINEFLYLGPLQPLMSDPNISEIMVNGAGLDEDGNMLPHEVWIERSGMLQRCEGIRFEGEEHVRRVMNRIVGRVGRRIDDNNPIEDAALADGSRFNGTMYPLAPDGSTFNIRRFQEDRLDAQTLVESGTITEEQMDFLATCVASRCSILISGGTGSGKTTLLNVLSDFIPPNERIITIEDTCELLVHKHHRHVVRFEARKANSEGAGTITLDDHLAAALRKRPDRIIIGECRGSEAYTMLEAMNTGHEGSMTTIHANDPRAALMRLMTLVKSSDSTISEGTVKAKIADALDLVVQIQRLGDGSRRVMSIQAIGAYSDGSIQHEPLWRYERLGVGAGGEHLGRHVSCRQQPTALRRRIIEAGYEYRADWFVAEAVV